MKGNIHRGSNLKAIDKRFLPFLMEPFTMNISKEF